MPFQFGLIALAVIGCGFLVQWVRVWRACKRVEECAKAAEAALVAKEYTNAIQLCDTALEIARKLKLRPNDYVALILVFRSESLRKLGKKDEALKAAVQACACSCAVRGAHTQVAILDQLGAMLLETGHERRAIPIIEAVIALGQQAEGLPLRTSARLEQVGLAYARVGIHANSTAAFGKAIEIMTKEFGADAVKLAHPYVNLGNGYKRTQKLEDAERCYREALRLIEINDAKTPEQLSLVLLNLGAVCSESGRYEEAERRYREVLELRIAAYGRNHWRVGNTYYNLANCVRQMRNFDAAEEYIQKAIEILEARPESLSNAIDTLSRLREDQGRVDEALEAATRARETQQNLPTPDLTELATLFEREALLAGRMGDQERANDCRSRAAQIRQAVAAAPPPDRDLTNMPEALQTLEQHLQASLQHVRALGQAL